MTVQDIIKNRRKALRLTLKDVANALHVSEATVSRYESGEIQNMGIDKIKALSLVLECSPAYLMGWDDKPNALPVAPAQASSTDERILKYYRQLNSDGQKKLCERAEELIELGYSNKGDVEKIG